MPHQAEIDSQRISRNNFKSYVEVQTSKIFILKDKLKISKVKLPYKKILNWCLISHQQRILVHNEALFSNFWKKIQNWEFYSKPSFTCEDKIKASHKQGIKMFSISISSLKIIQGHITVKWKYKSKKELDMEHL